MSDQGSAKNNERPASYPYSEMQTNMQTAASNLAGRVRHSARNAFYCIHMAWQVAPIDPNIAAFRAITAEEEAATALIIALKQIGYPSSEKLSHKLHPHKAGLIPFIRGISKAYGDMGFPEPKAKFRFADQRPSINVYFPGDILGLPGHRIDLVDPLEGVFTTGSMSDQKHHPMDFGPILQSLADSKGAGTIKKLILDEANLRNQLLYAGDQGVLRVKNPDPFIHERAANVTLLLAVTVAVCQVAKPQLLAIQAVQAYLNALEVKDIQPHDFSDVINKTNALFAESIDLMPRTFGAGTTLSSNLNYSGSTSSMVTASYREFSGKDRTYYANSSGLVTAATSGYQ
jgi:hypothetical protein